MPLSEDEQRILTEIEQQFHSDDPTLARAVGETTIYRHAFRNIRKGLLGCLVGFVLLIMTLSTNIWFAFGSFILVFLSAMVVVSNASKLGKAGLQELGLVAGGRSGNQWATRLRRKSED